MSDSVKWNKTTNSLPKENELVWLASENLKSIHLGCRVYLQNEGWFWAVADIYPYADNGKIVADCEIADIDVTHWKRLPKLPFE